MCSNAKVYFDNINEVKNYIFNFFKNANYLFTYDSDYNEFKFVGNKYIYIDIYRKIKWCFYF